MLLLVKEKTRIHTYQLPIRAADGSVTTLTEQEEYELIPGALLESVSINLTGTAGMVHCDLYIAPTGQTWANIKAVTPLGGGFISLNAQGGFDELSRSPNFTVPTDFPVTLGIDVINRTGIALVAILSYQEKTE